MRFSQKACPNACETVLRGWERSSDGCNDNKGLRDPCLCIKQAFRWSLVEFLKVKFSHGSIRFFDEPSG